MPRRNAVARWQYGCTVGLRMLKTFSIPSKRYKALATMARVVPSGVLQKFQSLGRK